ncbi:UdgX family uracil-DNA binding protein [Luteolibacter ambystomatis]|uniref:Type-4 uracil-DNA glycosylase n=1 Tax=Luteolibacter ambystomatis TaxID=2824561 RepID=A0A975J3E9_9BACT|nr:UdgX family uracil-DNA binding protein [Luteolibacter ambystomatis]
MPTKSQLIGELEDAIRTCRNCPLWKNATQAVCGEGRPSAKILMIGEQPGNQEDLEGRPFVGPAGRVLDRALHDAGIDRSKVWVTNAVKHFKWKPKGKIRLHQKPSTGEIDACKPWLLRELSTIAPQVVVILGATAARAVLGTGIKVTQQRGLYEAPSVAPKVILTVHPSSLLRRSGHGFPEEEYQAFVSDLKLILG